MARLLADQARQYRLTVDQAVHTDRILASAMGVLPASDTHLTTCQSGIATHPCGICTASIRGMYKDFCIGSVTPVQPACKSYRAHTTAGNGGI